MQIGWIECLFILLVVAIVAAMRFAAAMSVGAAGEG